MVFTPTTTITNATNNNNANGTTKNINKKLKTNNPESEVTTTTKNAVSTAQSTTTTTVQKYDAKMLESFWKLSEYNAKVRMEGMRQISDYFAKLDAHGNKEAYNYVLVRLVRGLASNRKCSRLGFSSALTELLIRFDSLRFESILEIAEKNLNIPSSNENNNNNDKNNTSKRMKLTAEQALLENLALLSKEEMRHMQIGMVFIYLCWIQSNRLEQYKNNCSEAAMKLLDRVLNKLNEMRKSKEIKEYIQQLYLNAFIMLVKRLYAINRHLIEEKCGPMLKEDLKALQKAFTTTTTPQQPSTPIDKDSLHILLACLNASNQHQHHQNGTSSSSSSSSSDQLMDKLKSVIFKPANYDRLYEMVSKSSDLLPNVQPICLELIEYGMSSTKQQFSDFWLHVIDAKLLMKKEPEKKLLSYKLYLMCLKHLNESNYEVMFTNCLLASTNLLKTLVNNLLLRASNLNELVNKRFMREFVDIVGLNEVKFSKHSFGADLLIKLIEHAAQRSNVHDMSELVNSVIVKLNANSLIKLFDYLNAEYKKDSKIVVANNEDDEEKMDESQLQNKKFWIVTQMTNLAKNAALFENQQLVDKLISSLIVNAYFEPISNTNNNKYKLILKSGNKCVVQLRDSLFKYFGMLINNNNKKYQMNVVIVNAIKLVEGLLLTRTSEVADDDATAKKMIKDLSALSQRMLKLQEKICKHIQKMDDDVNKDVLQTFFMIISFEYLKMFESARESKKIIDDIEVCFEKFQNQKKKSNNDDDDEVDWIDFLVEMLMNLLTLNNGWIRNTVKVQFKKLFPKLTTQSVQLIIDMLEPSDNSLVTEANSDYDDNEDEEDDKNEIKKNGNNSNKRSLDDNNDDEEEEEDDEDEDDDDDDEESSESSDDDDDDEEMDMTNGPECNKELKDALLKSLGNVVVDPVGNGNNEEEFVESDLDDEAMLKLDETIAQAFRMRTQAKRTKQDIMHVKLRALDMIQELFKTTHRLDLITYAIKPMLHILFESQKKPNLKNISQRILGFLVNLKHTTKKLNDCVFPKLDDIFDLLNHVIKCSTVHFNVTNTLIETSMFCVRLIQHLANNNKSSTTKEAILNRLNEIYLNVIKNFYDPELIVPSPAEIEANNKNNKNKKSKNPPQPIVAVEQHLKINPSMYKEYLLRYPANSNKLALKMIELASLPNVKLHKKTVTLITLYQTIKNEMFNDLDQETIDEFIAKIFIFFNKIIDEIIQDENVHIKFLDAFLNLVAKVLNLKKNFIKEHLIDTFTQKLVLFTKETKVKQAYKNRCHNLIQVANQSKKKTI